MPDVESPIRVNYYPHNNKNYQILLFNVLYGKMVRSPSQKIAISQTKNAQTLKLVSDVRLTNVQP